MRQSASGWASRKPSIAVRRCVLGLGQQDASASSLAGDRAGREDGAELPDRRPRSTGARRITASLRSRPARRSGRRERTSATAGRRAALMPMRGPLAGPRRRRRAVVDDRRPPIGGHEVGAVERAGRCRAPGTAWPGRCTGPGRAGPPDARPASRSSPGSGAPARSSTAIALALVAAHGVGAPVHAVGEVHVEAAGRPEHGGVARRRAPVGVAGRIVGAAVGLDLDDPAGPVAGTSTLLSSSGATSRAVAPVEPSRQPRPRRLTADHAGIGGPSPARTSSGTAIFVGRTRLDADVGDPRLEHRTLAHGAVDSARSNDVVPHRSMPHVDVDHLAEGGRTVPLELDP